MPSEPPLITFVIFAYNQGRFIREAVNAALSQTYSPLEIILSDDCSVDKTFEIMTEIAEHYTGPHKIMLNRNETNLGIGAHVNRIMELACGELIVAAAGDDISVPDRVRRIYDAYRESGGAAKSIFSNNMVIDTSGGKHGAFYAQPPDPACFLPEMIIQNDHVLDGCSHAWSKEVFDLFGPLHTPLTCEDKAIPFRSSLIGEIRYVHEELTMHRRHDANTWNYGKDSAAWQHFLITERLEHYENWLRDLARFEALFPDRHEKAESLRASLIERMVFVKADVGLLESSWIRRAFSLLGMLITKKMPFRSVCFRIGIMLMPNIYNRYMAIKYAIRGQPFCILTTHHL